MAHEIGEKVGAILSGDSATSTVKFLGWGTYRGLEKPPNYPYENPKIELDDGKIVWGFECWWGNSAGIKKMLSQYEHVVKVDIDEERKAHSGAG